MRGCAFVVTGIAVWVSVVVVNNLNTGLGGC